MPNDPPAGDAPQQIQHHLDELQRHQKAMRTNVLLATLLIVLIVLGFGWAGYRKVSQAVNRDTLAAAVQERAKVLVPQVAQKLGDAAQLAAPKYRELAFQRLQAAGPEIREQATKELADLTKDLKDELHARVEASAVRVTKRIGDEVKRDFPALTGAQQEKLLEALHDDLAQQASQIQGRLESMMVQEGEKVQNILVKLDPGALTQADRQALEQRLLHHLIMLADYYVTGEVNPHTLHDGATVAVAAPAADGKE